MEKSVTSHDLLAQRNLELTPVALVALLVVV